MPSSRRCWSSIGLSSRHCEPTGRANARPMTGSAKQSTLRFVAMDCFAALAMMVSALRQEADYRIGEGVRLLDIGNMRGVEDGQAGAGDLAADQFAARDWRCHVMPSGDHQGRAFYPGQKFALVERGERLAAGEIAFNRASQQH